MRTCRLSSVPLPGFPANMTYLGDFTLSTVNENNEDSDNTGSVGWTFTLANNDPTLQSLAYGQDITQVYAVTLDDQHGGTVTQNVTVTIHGTNDVPIIMAASTVSGGVTEDANGASFDLSASGAIAFQDVDLIDTHTATFALDSATSSAHLPGFPDRSPPSAASR